VARTNVSILRVVSHGMNTFPSGHVAVSVACALSVARIWPEAGVALGVVAAAVAVGAAAGRYHFIIDVALGAILGTVAALFTS
jgi:membrane-associated phospholipid phosphatase